METTGLRVMLHREPRYISSRNLLRRTGDAARRGREGNPMDIAKFRPEQWVSVTTAASLAGVHREWMRRLAKAGRVQAFEIEGQWFVFRRDAEKYVRGKSGRPRKQEPR
jgi:hypothetical protein